MFSIYLGDVISSLKPLNLLIIIMPFIERRSLDVVDGLQRPLKLVLNFAKIFLPEIEILKILLKLRVNFLNDTLSKVVTSVQYHQLIFDPFQILVKS